MSGFATIAEAAVALGAAAALAIACTGFRTAPSARALPFVATALAAATGGFLASRGLDLEHFVVVGTVVASLAAAAGAARLGGIRDVLALGLLALLVSSVAGRELRVPLAALAGSLPFVPSVTLRAERLAALCCALLAAIACGTFGLGLGLATLFAGSVTAFVAIAPTRRRLTLAHLVPAISLCALAGILVESALTV